MSQRMRHILILVSLCLACTALAVMSQTRKATKLAGNPKNVQAEIRAAYQQIADAYTAKQPDVVLKHYASNFTSTIQYLGNKPETRDREAFEEAMRSHFPGNSLAPSQTFQIGSIKSTGPNAVTVVLWVYNVAPIAGSDPDRGNLDGSYSVIHQWVKQKTWKLQKEQAKAVENFPEDQKNTIRGRKP